MGGAPVKILMPCFSKCLRATLTISAFSTAGSAAGARRPSPPSRAEERRELMPIAPEPMTTSDFGTTASK